jgi:hypothetical protein
MKKTTLVSMLAVGLAMLPVAAALAAVNPEAPNPYPNRESKLLVDFESDVAVTSDALGTGENRASINTDAQFVAEGGKSLKIDETGAAAGGRNHFTITFPQPIDIKGYQVLAMDIFVPDDSVNDSWYQFQPRLTTTDPSDETKTVVTGYGPGNLHKGWNHLIWSLRTGTDTKLTQLEVRNNSGSDYLGPIYVDEIRLYKGNFVGLQPDEKLVMGFEKPSDKDLFTTRGTDVNGEELKVDVNTDKQFVTEGQTSLKIDLTGQPGGWTSSVARADDWGTTIDASKATAIHLDFFIPPSSYTTAESYNELGFGVIGEGGEVWGDTNFVGNGQWVTMKIPLKPEQAAMLSNIKGLFFMTNSGADWNGPIYVDALRVVVPTEAPPPAAGG